jgi:uncharacterized protein (DUF1810 family)
MFDHFLRAQDPVYEIALRELRAGRKQSHWMWFMFPQIAGLGASPTSRRFALHSLHEAREFLTHPVLGARLRQCTEAVLTHADKRTAHTIFGSPDGMKFHSSITLFHRAAPDEILFRRSLDAFFGGQEDEATLTRL